MSEREMFFKQRQKSSSPFNEILYQSDELSTRIEILIEDETIWHTQQQIIELFNSSKANISEHIKHIFETVEMDESSTVRNFRTVRMECCHGFEQKPKY